AGTAASIRTAIQNAKPGAVITVELTDPFNLDIGAIIKRDPGVWVIFDPAQVFSIAHNASATVSNLHFIGGVPSYDLVPGNDPAAAQSYGVYCGPNASKISFRGMRFDQSRNSIFLDRATDIVVDKCVSQ
ncbi:hypothetical protein RZS08_45690, partial [Arthrospira platensis SPKY1]|nr:hypothetical protein [Arthrospira platensis SPKY1]